MAKDQTKRINPDILKADLKSLTSIQSFSDYRPANPAYAQEELAAVLEALKAAQTAEVNAQNALDAARDAATAAEWNLHNAVLAAKDQVRAQYGDDSDQVQALGLKKKSERKRPSG